MTKDEDLYDKTIEDVFDEFLDGEDPVFQNAVVHIGTDESANTNENMRRYINDLAQYCLAKDNIDEVYFWGNLSLYYGFNEIDPDHVAAQVWDSADQRVDEALASGFDVINSTSNSLYLIPGNANGLHNGYVDMSTFYETWDGVTDFDTNRQSNPSYTAIIIAHMICYWAIRRSWVRSTVTGTTVPGPMTLTSWI